MSLQERRIKFQHFIVLTISFIGVAFNCDAEEIATVSVANRTVQLPAPDGFTMVTEAMVAVQQLNESTQDTLNDLLASYIPDSEIGTALSGVLPEMQRSFLVKVNKELQYEKFTQADFLEMQQVIDNQNSGAYQEIEYEVTRQLADSEQNNGLDVDAAMKISKIVPLEVHFKDQDIFSHSMYINYGRNEGDEQDTIVAATLNYLNLDGTILFLYAFAPQDELLWSQESSLAWSKKVLAANTTDRPAFGQPLIIAILVIGIALLVFLMSRQKENNV